MTERPIIFSAPMIRALLDGRKAMTRRVIVQSLVSDTGDVLRYMRKKYEIGDLLWVREAWRTERAFDGISPRDLPYLEIPGLPIWRECDGPPPAESDFGNPWGERKRPSIHMPRWASRITLKVTAVKVERLQDISEEDAIAEGIARIGREYIERGMENAFSSGPYFWNVEGMDFAGNWPTARECFASLWYRINGDPKDQWEATPFNAQCWQVNPWVSAISFERVK